MLETVTSSLRPISLTVRHISVQPVINSGTGKPEKLSLVSSAFKVTGQFLLGLLVIRWRYKEGNVRSIFLGNARCEVAQGPDMAYTTVLVSVDPIIRK